MASLRKLIRKFQRMRDPLCGTDEQQWLDHTCSVKPVAVGIVEPDWRGVYSSMTNLFPVCLPVRDSLTKRSAERVANLILETGVSRVVFAELHGTYIHLLEVARASGAENRRLRYLAQQLHDVERAQLEIARGTEAARRGRKDQENRLCQVGDGRSV